MTLLHYRYIFYEIRDNLFYDLVVSYKIDNMEIMTYPIAYIRPVQLKNGDLVQLRPIHPLDEENAYQFRTQLSDQSIRDRFLGYIPSVSEKLIKRLTKIDYDREMAIVAEYIDGKKKIPIAVARIVGEIDSAEKAEFALIVADKWQGKGLGTLMTDYMIDIAKDMDFKFLYALLFAHNTDMKAILEKRGFNFSPEGFDTELGVLNLTAYIN